MNSIRQINEQDVQVATQGTLKMIQVVFRLFLRVVNFYFALFMILFACGVVVSHHKLDFDP